MKKNLLFALLASLVISASPGLCDAPATSETSVLVRSTRVTMQKPAGFEESKDFSGFSQADTHSSVLVTELPAPFALATAGFTTEGLASRGMKLLSRADVQVGDYPGLLLEVEQSGYGIVFRKWLTAFGDKDITVVVTASFPLDKADTLSSALKSAVLTARYDKQLKIANPIDNLPFTVSGTTNLKIAGVIQNTLMMNASGEMPKPGKLPTKKSVFVVGRALGNMAVGDRAVFTKARLQKTDSIKDVEIVSENDVEKAGLPAREIVATATEKDGGRVVVFLTLVFPADTYYIMQGIADIADRETMVPEFREVANSFKFKAQ